EVRGDERTSHGGVRLARDEVVRDQELGEGGRDLGDGGRRLEGERVPRRSGERVVDAVPELVSELEHVVCLPGVAHEDIGRPTRGSTRWSIVSTTSAGSSFSRSRSARGLRYPRSSSTASRSATTVS